MDWDTTDRPFSKFLRPRRYANMDAGSTHRLQQPEEARRGLVYEDLSIDFVRHLRKDWNRVSARKNYLILLVNTLLILLIDRLVRECHRWASRDAFGGVRHKRLER